MRLFRVVGPLVAAGAWFLTACLPANANYTTFHYDNSRSGFSGGVGFLTPSYIPGHFTQVANVTLDGGEVDAQPVEMTGSTSPTVFVATEKNGVYAFSNAGALRWVQHYGAPVPNSYGGGCGNTAPEIGIQSTPVIDTAANILYFVAYTLDNGTTPTYRLHGVSASNGADVIAPAVIQPPGAPAFNAGVQRQRAALLEANGNIYVSFASFCDFFADRSYGQIVSYSASSFAYQGRFVTTNYGLCSYHLGSIWMSGFGPAADASGNVYFTTGNGCIAYGNVSNGAFSQAVLKLTPGLRLNDNTSTLFAPCNAVNESNADLDLGSGGVTLLPDQAGSVPHLLATGGKTGLTYMLNRDWLGGQNCPDRSASATSTNGGLWGGHAAYTGADGATYIAVGGNHTAINVYRVNSGGSLSLVGSTNAALTGEGGTSPVVTGTGSAGNYMLWYLTRPDSGSGTIYLLGYDLTRLSSAPVVNVIAGNWANPGGGPFLSPTIVGQRIYVASQNQLMIFGVRGPHLCCL